MYLEKFKEPTRPLPKHIWNKLSSEDKKTTIVPVLIKRPVIVTFGIIETNVIYGHSKKTWDEQFNNQLQICKVVCTAEYL